MKRYFVTSIYRPCGTKKIEDLLYDIAKGHFEHTIVHEDCLAQIAADLSFDQDQILSANKRLRPVEVKLWPERVHGDGYRSITLGQVHIQMVEVLAEYSSSPKTIKE